MSPIKFTPPPTPHPDGTFVYVLVGAASMNICQGGGHKTPSDKKDQRPPTIAVMSLFFKRIECHIYILIYIFTNSQVYRKKRGLHFDVIFYGLFHFLRFIHVMYFYKLGSEKYKFLFDFKQD